MLTIEKKIITFVEKHIFVLAVVLVTVAAFLMRRQSIWYHSQDYIYYFDMHEGTIQSAFYYLLVRMMGYGFDIPLHGIKWLVSAADFGVALLCVILYQKELKEQTVHEVYGKARSLLLYAGCLVAPVIYIRGCVWAQVDSAAFGLLLGALCLYQRDDRAAQIGAVLAAGLGAALYPCVAVVVIVYFCGKKGLPERRRISALLATVVFAVVWNGICGVLIGETWEWGVSSQFRWMTYQPYTGELYTEPAEWLWQMFLLGSYGAALYSGVAALRRKIPYAAAVILQIMITVCYGFVLGW